MKTQTSFVRSDSTVELYPVTAVDLYFTFIINPWNSEHDNSFGLNHFFQNLIGFVFGVCLIGIPNRFNNFFHCLMEFVFTDSFCL